MSGRKRSYAVFASGSEPNLTILTADGGRVAAHNDVLRFLCSSLRNSPSSDTWDLRNLIIDDRPASSATVTSLLEVIYCSMQAVEYKPESPTDFDIPEICRMLLLADAVGCSRGIIEKIASLLGTEVPLEVNVTVKSGAAGGSGQDAAGTPAAGRSHDYASTDASAADAGPQTITIRLDSTYSVSSFGKRLLLVPQSADSTQKKMQLHEQAVQVIQQQLCFELELLLYVAFKLDLPTLRERVLQFLSNQADHCTLLPAQLLHTGNVSESTQASASTTAGSGPELSATIPPVKPVFSARVSNAAGGSIAGRNLLTKACLQRPLGPGFGEGTFFKLEYGTINTTEFKAVLQRDLYPFKAGSKVALAFNARGECIIMDKQHTLCTEYSVVLGQMRALERMSQL